MKYVLGILFLTVCGCIGKKVQVKIVDPPHTNRYYPSSSNTNQEISLRAPPANISGPPHLQLLAGECFKTREKRYTYSICPFHNITQKEDYSSWNNFYGVLGIWREWIIEDDRFIGMLYSLGESCGNTDREAKVMFRCSTVTKFTNISELSTCKYTIWMSTPLACFKGLMQIYSVLSPTQINRWEVLNEQYHNEELTRQGLNKKRRKILLEAGLYYNFTKDEEYLKITYNSNDVSQPVTVNSWIHGDQCKEKVSSLENDLRSVKMELENIKEVLDAHPVLKQEIMKVLSQNVTQNNTKILNWSTATRITNMPRQENRIENDFKDQRKLVNQESDQEDLMNQEPDQEDTKNQEPDQEYLKNQEHQEDLKNQEHQEDLKNQEPDQDWKNQEHHQEDTKNQEPNQEDLKNQEPDQEDLKNQEPNQEDLKNQEPDQEDLKNQKPDQKDLKNQEPDQETNQGDQERDINIIQAERSNVERTRNLLEQADVVDEENLKIDELQPDK